MKNRDIDKSKVSNTGAVQAPLPGIEPTGEKIGYRRVSSGDQSLDRQLEGLTLGRVFEDKLSGKNRDRPGLIDCLAYMRSGDILHVHSIDRLARDLRDLQDLVQQIIEKGAAVKFEKENLTFSGRENDSMGNLLLQIMGAFAEFERSMIKERQREGIDIALKKGTKFGRTPVVTPEIAEKIKNCIENGETRTETAKQCGISRQSVYNYLKKKDVKISVE